MPERRQLAKLSAGFAACSPEVKGYGQCIAANAANIERGVCEREYQLLYKCLRQAVRVLAPPVCARSCGHAPARAVLADEFASQCWVRPGCPRVHPLSGVKREWGSECLTTIFFSTGCARYLYMVPHCPTSAGREGVHATCRLTAMRHQAEALGRLPHAGPHIHSGPLYHI